MITSGKAPALLEDFSGPTYSLNPQNALSKLDELRPGLVYNLEPQTGPDHLHVFRMIVQVILFKIQFVAPFLWELIKVDGGKYFGQGKTKMLAQIQAAEAALKKLDKLKDLSIVTDIKLG